MTKPLTKFAALLVGLMCLSGCYNRTNYSGSGELLSIGLLHPWYQIQMRPLNAAENGEYTYRFKGAPPLSMYFGLVSWNVSDKTLRQIAAQAGIHVRTILTDSNGQVLFDVTDDLSRGWIDGKGGWVLSAGGPDDKCEFYRPETIGVKLSTRKEYVWQVIIQTKPDSEVRTFILTPRIEGGGCDTL